MGYFRTEGFPLWCMHAQCVASVGRRVGVALVLLLVPGCVVGTREPLYERRRDAVFDEGMVGTWRGEDAGNRQGAGAVVRVPVA